MIKLFDGGNKINSDDLLISSPGNHRTYHSHLYTGWYYDKGKKSFEFIYTNYEKFCKNENYSSEFRRYDEKRQKVYRFNTSIDGLIDKLDNFDLFNSHNEYFNYLNKIN